MSHKPYVGEVNPFSGTYGMMGTTEAEETQPHAWVHISDEPKIDIKIITKPLKGVPWNQKVQYNYFYGKLFINDKEVEHNDPWAQSPSEAVQDALTGWMRQLVANTKVYGSELWDDFHSAGYQFNEYYVIEHTHPEYKR